MNIGTIIFGIISAALPIALYIIFYEKGGTDGFKIIFYMHSLAFFGLIVNILSEEGFISKGYHFFCCVHLFVYIIALFFMILMYETQEKEAKETNARLYNLEKDYESLENKYESLLDRNIELNEQLKANTFSKEE